MLAPERTIEGVARLGTIAALAGVALVLIAGRLFFWTRHFLGGGANPRRPFEAVAASGRRVVLLEMVASLAAAIGLLGTFLDLRNGELGVTPAEAGRLSSLFAPALAGLGVFIFCQGALGFFRSWSETLKTETVLAPPPPVVLPPDILRPADAPSPPRRPRRPAAAPARPSAGETVVRSAVVLACMLGSVLVHGGVLYVAQRVQIAPGPTRDPDRAGVFLARIVNLPAPAAPPAPPPEEIKEEPVPPPKPRPAVNEAPPPEAPKAETPEAAPLTERPKAEPLAEKPKTEAPPPPPAAEAKEPESDPRARPAESKEAERARPAPAPPAAKLTEAPAPAKEAGTPPPGDPAPSPPAPAPAASSPAKAPAEAPVLGLGDPGRVKEPEETPSGSDPRGSSPRISTMKEYRQFLARDMKSGAAEGQYVPNLRFGDNKAQENREIMRYFGMELIAYPKNQKFYVYIDPEQKLFSRSNDFAFIKNFSSRAIFRTSPYFDALRVEAARRVDVPSDSLVVAQLLKPSSAAYIGWKESECARRAGVALDAVDACEASFVKSPFGVWIVKIDRLLLKDGRTLPVEDFEWAKVSQAGGGER